MVSKGLHHLLAGDTVSFGDLSVPAGKELPGAKINATFNFLDSSTVAGGPPNITTSSVPFIQLGTVGPPDSTMDKNITLARDADVMFNFQGTFMASTTSTYVRLRPKIGATIGNVWEFHFPWANNWVGISFTDIFTNVPAGTHLFDMEWARGGGVGFLTGHTNRRILNAYSIYQ